MAREIDGSNFNKRNRNKDGVQVIEVPESLKGRKFKELSVTEIQELGELNASQDRFRYRYNEDDYKNDVIKANVNLRWID